MSRILALMVSVWWVSSPDVLFAQNWDRFRGPNGSGVSDVKGLPTNWTASDYRWKVELPGSGHGSPVVWEQKLFVNCATDDGSERIVQCRSTRTGDLLWERRFPSHPHKTHKFNSFATSTPCVDRDRVYSSWGTPEELTLVALTHDGELVWENREMGKVHGGHGFGTSPIVHAGMVVMANDTERDSSLFALDAATGNKRWELPRPGGRLNFATPCVFPLPDREDILIFSAWPIGISAVNAQTGTLEWEVESYDTSRGQRSVASPIVSEDFVLANCAFTNNPKHLVVLKPHADGAVEQFRVDNSTVPHLPTLLAHRGLVYAWSEKGICTCYELDSGKKVWQERIGGNFYSSPICVDEVLYCTDGDGECVVIRAGRKFEELGRVDLGEASRATPAVGDGRMYFRTASHLMAIDPLTTAVQDAVE